ncbi:MAG: hypothetical protein RIG61_01555 [Deltaproteobacteria bacterium]
MNNNTEKIIDEVIEAHGGIDRWKSLVAVEAVISASGFLFTAKRRPAQSGVRVRAFRDEPRFIACDFPEPGHRSELIGDKEVRILDSRGNVIASRINPRAAFKSLRSTFYWDDLDFIYFGGYAEWNYLLTPFIFLRDGFKFKVLEPIAGIPDSWLTLEVTFPDDLPTHCKRQIFYFDEKRLLRRLDYTAEVVGSWAKGVHLCEGYRDFHGFKVPTLRTVKPHFYGARYLPFPTLIFIEVHDFKPIERGDML